MARLRLRCDLPDSWFEFDGCCGWCVCEVNRLSSAFPNDVEYKVVYDSTWVVDASIKEVIITLFATCDLGGVDGVSLPAELPCDLIPTITIPVALIGTFSVLLALGYSLNMLTLFGIVLVIGIVVDDAILVVENTFVHLEKGLSGKRAAEECMKEVTGPVVATTLGSCWRCLFRLR